MPPPQPPETGFWLNMHCNLQLHCLYTVPSASKTCPCMIPWVAPTGLKQEPFHRRQSWTVGRDMGPWTILAATDAFVERDLFFHNCLSGQKCRPLNTWNFVTAIIIAIFMKCCLFPSCGDINLMGTAFLDELRQLRSVDGNFGPHIHAPQRVISFLRRQE